jgi:protein transport protein SEC61 subunit gamma-like protein
MLESLTSFLVQCRRVWAILKKPTMDDVKSVSKITALGLLVIGLLGFLISIIMSAL